MSDTYLRFGLLQLLGGDTFGFDLLDNLFYRSSGRGDFGGIELQNHFE